MANKLIFLSHIHEEKDLAITIKNALEEEFSGFVDVFVSSDGTTIPAGANFLKHIEDGLVDCIAAIYLISPSSVKRNWINFELGAVWIRNVISTRNGGVNVPAVPVCHSGITPAGLPAPLNNLNGIVASQASQLEFAFQSIQTAVGGKGRLKTNFNDLAASILALEHRYTMGASIVKMVEALGISKPGLVDHCEKLTPGQTTQLNVSNIRNTQLDILHQLEANELKGVITVAVESSGVLFGPRGSNNVATVVVSVPVSTIVNCKQQLLK